MASKADPVSSVVLKRVVDVEFLSSKTIHERIKSGSAFNVEEVQVGGKSLPFSLVLPAGVKLDQKAWTSKEEGSLALALHSALVDARKLNKGLINEHGVWTWLGVEVLRDYVVNRWCDGYEGDGITPKKESGCTYFLTGDSVHSQTRCAVRRLWIAAETSIKADGDDRWAKDFLENSDVFSAIFERRLGMDPVLAVTMLERFLRLGTGSRKIYRRATKLIGLILSTTSLEALERKEKEELVDDAIKEAATSLIDGE